MSDRLTRPRIAWFIAATAAILATFMPAVQPQAASAAPTSAQQVVTLRKALARERASLARERAAHKKTYRLLNSWRSGYLQLLGQRNELKSTLDTTEQNRATAARERDEARTSALSWKAAQEAAIRERDAARTIFGTTLADYNALRFSIAQNTDLPDRVRALSGFQLYTYVLDPLVQQHPACAAMGAGSWSNDYSFVILNELGGTAGTGVKCTP